MYYQIQLFIQIAGKHIVILINISKIINKSIIVQILLIQLQNVIHSVLKDFGETLRKL